MLFILWHQVLMFLLQADAKPVSSCLVEDKRGMKRAMIEVVASGAVVSLQDVERYIRCTLLAATTDYQEVVAKSTKAALGWLVQNGFLRSAWARMTTACWHTRAPVFAA